MYKFSIVKSISEIGRLSWNSCCVSEVEDYDYLLAVESSHLEGFEWRYLAAWQEGRLVACMPAFLNEYSIDTTLQGPGKKIVLSLKKIVPRLLTLRLACLGSPCTERGKMGFSRDVPAAEKPGLICRMMEFFEQYAAENNIQVVGVKDLPEPYTAVWERAIQERRLAKMPSLPTAYLDIDFATEDEYLATLSYSTRKNMRRKLKSFQDVRIEECHDIDKIIDKLMELYRDTRLRSEWQFEDLTADYFLGIIRNMPERAFCQLYYHQDDLLAINVLIRNENILIDKFFCMNGQAGREYNLYFLSWFVNLRYCLQHKLIRYQSGQAYYENKVRLGSQLTRNSIYFKHRNKVVQFILKLLVPILAADDGTERLLAS